MANELGFLAHREGDMVAVATRDVGVGLADYAFLDSGRRESIEVLEPIPLGHKVAILAIGEGSEVVEYGQRVALAKAEVSIGSMVHVHNVRSARWQVA